MKVCLNWCVFIFLSGGFVFSTLHFKSVFLVIIGYVPVCVCV